MPWFKVDDRLHASRKVRRIPRPLRLEAMGLWVISGSWAAGEGLDGFVPDYMVEEFGGRQKLVDALVAAGLWVSVPDGTAFHAWTEYNPDSETVQAGREAKSDGAKHANHKRWHVKRRTKVPGCEWCFPNTSVTDQITDNDPIGYPIPTDDDANPPDPTRPDPTSKEVKDSRIVDAFERAYGSWPKKVEKKKSLDKFRLLSKKHDPDWLADHVVRFGLAYANTTEKRFVPALVVWLNGERWTDEPPTAGTDVINAQWDALMGETKDPCRNGHKWAADNSCVRCLVLKEIS